ncbi:M1 family aminopeptidase [Marinigracilibium pacificum]|uniref:Peptidase M1 membrane alanine aminopeptidase domain-containing protein n=1 Tax=Marinigracilibium pacificum TaxID=2729599 RepID=A0A848J630_9BACT|nr:M1 family aminopeptidase [Marinigracilibium pacificum]NMM49924.1 hypothetical protein [Marinigracilibium pacificum]
MLSNLIKFEFYYQRKQLTLVVLSLVFMLIGLRLGSQGFSPADVNYDSFYQIGYITGIMTLGIPFIVMFFTISGIIRDKKHHFEQIIYSTSVNKSQYFFSRLSGILVFSILCFSPFLIGFYLGTFYPGLDPEKISGFNFYSYFSNWFIFIIPNVFICTAFIFTVSLLSKNALATYVTGILIYAIYMMSSLVLNSPIMAQSIPSTPEGLMIASLADPFGLAAFFEQTQYWTPFQKNNQPIQFVGFLLWNRVIWLLISIVILYVGYNYFSFRKINKKSKRNKIKTEPIPSVSYNSVSPNQSLMMKFLIMKSLIKSDLSFIFRNLPFIGIMIIWVTMVIAENYARIVDGGEYNNSMYPTTSLLIGHFTNILTFISLILIVFYSGELAWRNKESKINEIIDSTPVSNYQIFISKLIVLISLPFSLILSGIILSICFQLYLGFYEFKLPLYLSTFYFYGLRLLFYCFLAIFITQLVSKKYLAIGITAVLIILFGSFPEYIGINTPLLKLGLAPIPSYTNLNGFSISSEAFHYYAWYWISFGLLLSIIAFQLLNRGYSSLKFRFSSIKWNKNRRVFSILVIISFVASATTIHYQVNIKNKYLSVTDILDRKEQYERKFKQYDSLKRLNHQSWKTVIDLYPTEHRYSVKAKHQLQNKNEVPVYKAFINERTKLSHLEIERGLITDYDSIHGTYIIEFRDGILPGEIITMEYALEKTSTGFDPDRSIIENGSYITFRDFELMLGYSSSKEIENAFERKKRGLPAKLTIHGDEHLITSESNVEKIPFETIISTEDDQTAIGPGDLINQWTSNGRNYYQYKTPVKVIPTVGYFSARYGSQMDNHRGISIELFYHPEHVYNIDLIEESVKHTLDYCLDNFGPYPFDHIRIAEIPGHWPFGGFSHPGTISMVEDRLYLVDVRNTETFNLVAKRTIHEVAHQWWGGILTPKIVEGGSIFVEGFAKYTESVVIEKMYGKGASWQIAKTANDTYFKGRAYSTKPEPPIYLENNESYLAYGKHYTVLMAVRELIGENKVNQAMKTLIDRHRNNNGLNLISIELIDELYKVTPSEYHSLIDDWFKKTIRYDLSIKSSDVNKLSDGRYEVTIDVSAHRYETLDTGEEKKIKISEPIPVGLFTKHPSLVSNDQDILYFESETIIEGEQKMKIIVNDRPEFISIDPYGARSDKNMFDNLIKVSE